VKKVLSQQRKKTKAVKDNPGRFRERGKVQALSPRILTFTQEDQP
jgi:hypothetical protein